MTRLSTLPQHKMTRAYVRSVPCPDCGANAHEKCVGSKGQKRTSSHAARWGAYRESADSSNRKETEMTTKKIYGPPIKWDGGECPVPPDMRVTVKFRDGDSQSGHPAYAYADAARESWAALNTLHAPLAEAQKDAEPAAQQWDDIAVRVCRSVAELPDRDSPKGWPEAMLVTHEELHAIVLGALNDYQPTPQTAATQGEPAGELVERIRALGEDAARWRWLKDHARIFRQSPDMSGNHYWMVHATTTLRGPTLDAAIDAAKGEK